MGEVPLDSDHALCGPEISRPGHRWLSKAVQGYLAHEKTPTLE
jgi:hypothetical protein